MAANSQSILHAQQRVRERHAHLTAPPPRSFLQLLDLNQAEFRELLAQAAAIKAAPHQYATALSNRRVALLFQKTSTRTRVSFETGVFAMGGAPLYMDWRASNFMLASLKDEIRVLSRYVDLIMARVFSHADLDVMAQHSEVPVINGLSDWCHPCQALTDYMTMQEYYGELKDLHLVYIGDGNNVCHSLMMGALHAEAEITLCCPRAYPPSGALVQRLGAAGVRLRFVDEPTAAVKGADVIYTDTWLSMGEEDLGQQKLNQFNGYQVNEALLAHAENHTLFMHCLPAHRGVEVSDGVIDLPRSVVFDQAENRRFAQQALMQWLRAQARP